MGYRNFNREFEINEDKTASYLENAVTKITTEEDIDTLTSLIKLFKKNVPLTRRKYVIAYMLKEVLPHYHMPFNRREKVNNRREKNETFKNDYKAGVKAKDFSEEKTPHVRVEIPEDKATSIFISIGKNRRVYPRDLVGILIAVAGIDRERIGDIKVLANYSFVQLYTEDSQIAIDKLNGYEYRGRKLVVSFSHQKADENAAEVPSDSQEAEYSAGYEEDLSAEDAAAYAAAEKAAKDKEPFGY